MKGDTIIIRGARENNLKDVSLEIPKHQITVFTGVSGSGKSSLVLDTIAAKSRRELNDTFPSFVQQYLPKYGRPHVDAIENLPIAIVIDQKKPAQNSRSTVATYTDIAALLRLLFSRVGQPFVGYAESFSFNHPEGSCPRCSGLGEIRELDIHKLIDFDKSLNDEDTIHYIAFGKGGWRWIRYAHSGLFDLDKKIKDYSPEELDLFLNSPQIRLKNPPANWPKSAKYEGIIPRMYRSIINSEEGLLHAAVLNPMLNMGVCPDCHGTRLSPRVLSCKIEGINIADACAMSITRLNQWVKALTAPLAVDLKRAISARLTALEEIGLGYLSLDRAVGTLSGGEAQRCKIAKYINSSLADVLYILDEPSTGLHDHDIEKMKHSVRRLRDAGNTVLLVEHHREMIGLADHIVDLGPGPGSEGGRIIFEGNYPQLLHSGTSTGQMLSQHGDFKAQPRQAVETFALRHATLHNLKDISIDLPMGIFGAVAGVAGSGKSSARAAESMSPAAPILHSMYRVFIRVSFLPAALTQKGIRSPGQIPVGRMPSRPFFPLRAELLQLYHVFEIMSRSRENLDPREHPVFAVLFLAYQETHPRFRIGAGIPFFEADAFRADRRLPEHLFRPVVIPDGNRGSGLCERTEEGMAPLCRIGQDSFDDGLGAGDRLFCGSGSCHEPQKQPEDRPGKGEHAHPAQDPSPVFAHGVLLSDRVR